MQRPCLKHFLPRWWLPGKDRCPEPGRITDFLQLSLFHTISGSDLYSKQQFVQMTGDNLNSTNGFNSMQLQNRVRRIMVAKYNEIAFLLIVKGAVKDIQKSLLNHGFSDLITFDGSDGLFVARNSVVDSNAKVGHVSPSGFAITVRDI